MSPNGNQAPKGLVNILKLLLISMATIKKSIPTTKATNMIAVCKRCDCHANSNCRKAQHLAKEGMEKQNCQLDRIHSINLLPDIRVSNIVVQKLFLLRSPSSYFKQNACHSIEQQAQVLIHGFSLNFLMSIVANPHWVWVNVLFKHDLKN